MSVSRRKSITFFITLGASLVAVAIALNVSWVILNWREVALLLFGIIFFLLIIVGLLLNTTFLIREIRRNEQHDAFINAVTHELKTPVTSIRLYLQTLQTHGVDEAKRKDFYRIMLEDSDRLLATIEQILRTGRVGPASRKLNLLPIDLGPVVEECLARARALYQLSTESLRYSPGPGATILGDPDEVQAAVANLIDNAVKYSGRDIHVTVETARLDEKYVSVRVRDHGAGIPRTELKRIFKRFYRVPGPLAARVKGTGLGLYIVRSVARRHGGRSWAESDGPGRGSTFVLQFPVVK